jgi:hypothetical protein
MHRQLLRFRAVRAGPHLRLLPTRAGRYVRAGDAGGMPPHPAVRQLAGLAPPDDALVAPTVFRGAGRRGVGIPGLGTDRHRPRHGRRQGQARGQQLHHDRQQVGQRGGCQRARADGNLPAGERSAVFRLRRTPAPPDDNAQPGAVRDPVHAQGEAVKGWGSAPGPARGLCPLDPRQGPQALGTHLVGGNTGGANPGRARSRSAPRVFPPSERFQGLCPWREVQEGSALLVGSGAKPQPFTTPLGDAGRDRTCCPPPTFLARGETDHDHPIRPRPARPPRGGPAPAQGRRPVYR